MNSVAARRLILLGGLVGLLASGVEAQPSAADRARNVAANGLIGATRAAWDAYRARRPVSQAAAVGFAGGATVAGGKQLAASGRGYAPLAGRLVAAAGNSLSLSAGRGEPTLVLSMGPLLLAGVAVDSATVTRWRWRARVNVVQLGHLGYYATRDDFRFEAGTSARVGAPVFRKRNGLVTPHGETALAVQQLGVIMLAANSVFRFEFVGPDRRVVQVSLPEREIIGHEAVHVLQEDQYNFLVALPTERALVKRVPGLRKLGGYIDLGIVGPLGVLGLEQRIAYDRRPWEREATRLADPR